MFKELNGLQRYDLCPSPWSLELFAAVGVYSGMVMIMSMSRSGNVFDSRNINRRNGILVGSSSTLHTYVKFEIELCVRRPLFILPVFNRFWLDHGFIPELRCWRCEIMMESMRLFCLSSSNNERYKYNIYCLSFTVNAPSNWDALKYNFVIVLILTIQH